MHTHESHVNLRLMTRDLKEREGLHSADQKFLSNIETHGWVVTKVFKREGETGPEWAYSTGLFHSYQHPELAIFGLDLDNMHRIINNIGDAVKSGMSFRPGSEYQEIFARCGCRFQPVNTGFYRNYFGWGIWFYESDPFPVLQCFWPDREGKYPWDSGCVPEVVAAQPLLYNAL
jgi:Domain of unknown function (DUF4262)